MDVEKDAPNQVNQGDTIKAVNYLSGSFIRMHCPDFSKAETVMNEVLENQTVLIETLFHENSKFTDAEEIKHLTESLSKVKKYHAKLTAIKKEMVNLTERMAKVKKRAIKLQQAKEKQLRQRENERERELDRERQLIAKPVVSAEAGAAFEAESSKELNEPDTKTDETEQ